MKPKKGNRGKCVLIAEAGVNHNGSFTVAKKMIRVAAKVGADYIKFQTFDPVEVVTTSVAKADYQRNATGGRESQKKMLQRLCLTRDQFRLLKKECHRQGIGFLSTAFDPGSLKFVETLRPDFHKISSGDIDNVPLLRQVAGYRRPVILSTGMATLGEIRRALNTLAKTGLQRSKVTVLQCHTEYPTRPSEANLRVMDTLGQQFSVKTGLSDHTPGIFASLAAAARGAAVIEKHFTLNRSMRGPDHRASLTPREMATLVRGVREIVLCLGDGVKKPSPRERKIMPRIRRVLVATQPIRKGEKFSEKNMAPKRAERGVPASHWDQWLGKKAGRDYRPDEAI